MLEFKAYVATGGFNSLDLQHIPAYWVESRQDHVHLNDTLWSSFGTTPRTPPRKDLNVAVLVHTQV